MNKLACIVVLSVTSADALAQTAAPGGAGASPDQAAPLQEVVVTGTMIRGATAPVGSQMTVVDNAAITATGTTNTADLLATLPELNSFNIAPQGGQSEFNSGGSSTPGLHGLPGTATLVLIDGHRAVGDTPLLTVPDPSSIPPSAIDHIEVLADGGSAIYGSDAVAGVINIILKKNVNYSETNVSYAGANAYNTSSLEQLLGKTWGTGSAMLALSYEANSDLKNSDRNFYQLAPPGLQYVPTYNCQTPNVEIGAATYTGPGLTAGPFKACDPNLNADLFNQNRRYGMVATVRQDFGDNLHAFLDAKYTDELSREQIPAVAVATGADASGNPVVTVPNTNPYFNLPAGVTATSENVLLNSTNLGTLFDAFRSKSGMADAGVDIDLGHNWVVTPDFDYSWSSSSTLNPDNGGVNLINLATAVNGTTPATALNPFGPSSPAVATSVLNYPLWFYGDQRLFDMNVKADGTLLTLPGGDLKLAVGVANRHEEYSGSNPIGVPGQAGFNDNFVNASRIINAVFGELALPVIGPNNAMPGVQRLSISAAGRFDHYSDFGSTKNPKVGIDYVPVEELKLRASYGTSFHAPQLADSYGIDTRAGGGGPGAPPPGYVLPAGTPFTTAYIAGGRNDLTPELAKTFSAGLDWTPQYLPGLKASLTYFMIRFTDEVQIPPFNELFTNPVLESRFVYLNQTGNPAAPLAALTPAQIASIFSGVRLTGLLATVPFPPLWEVIDARRANIGSTAVDGWDFNLNFKHPVGPGSVLLGLSGEWLTEYESNAGPGTSYGNDLIDGNSYQTSDTSAYNVIAWHARGMVGWQTGSLVTQAYLNYTGHFNFGYVNSAGTSAIQWVSPFVTVDLNARYDVPSSGGFSDGLSVQVNVSNLLNAAPPLVEQTGGYSVESANPLGRLIRLTLTKRW